MGVPSNSPSSRYPEQGNSRFAHRFTESPPPTKEQLQKLQQLLPPLDCESSAEDPTRQRNGKIKPQPSADRRFLNDTKNFLREDLTTADYRLFSEFCTLVEKTLGERGLVTILESFFDEEGNYRIDWTVNYLAAWDEIEQTYPHTQDNFYVLQEKVKEGTIPVRKGQVVQIFPSTGYVEEWKVRRQAESQAEE